MTKSADFMEYNDYTACPDCDLLLKKAQLAEGQKASCPRCGALLDSRTKNSIQRSFAVVIAGLLSFVPAISMPLLGLEAAGLKNEASLLQCVKILFDSQLYFVTFLVV
ncbi:MAG: paraquat-inducible protein A, partial [Pseudomonadales bacterium]|nr:paraquat-inducible protein A [Pseudomonadales bacterium]